ncbi:hypothetical protein IIA16_01560 [bacterium]|nr:hypothetical protein [bacterium]
MNEDAEMRSGGERMEELLRDIRDRLRWKSLMTAVAVGGMLAWAVIEFIDGVYDGIRGVSQ